MDIGFIAVETFFPEESYKNWSNLYHIKEIISIDCFLCPRIIKYSENDYDYLQWLGDYWVFKTLDILLKKVEGKSEKQILAITREPEIDCKNYFEDKRFKFYGYDLLEDGTCISALSNCVGFEKAYQPNDISEYGLIEDFEKAKDIQLRLKEKYPYESHANCALWAIWRMEQI